MEATRPKWEPGVASWMGGSRGNAACAGAAAGPSLIEPLEGAGEVEWREVVTGGLFVAGGECAEAFEVMEA